MGVPNMISAFWCLSPNFGDALTPWIVSKLTGKPVTWVDPSFDAEYLVAGGSILNHAGPKAKIWGAGIATITDGVNPGCDIRAVRGPIARARALSCGAKCPEIYGDPAQLLPQFIQRSDPSCRFALVPHYVDQYRVRAQYPDAHIVDLLQPVEAVVSALAAAEHVYSSALHGIILAHAYGIPATWVQWSDSVGGDGTKFRDYFASVGMDIPYPADLRERIQLPAADSFIPKIDATAYLNAFPYERVL